MCCCDCGVSWALVVCCCGCGVSWALVVCFWGCSSSPCAPGTAAHQEMPAQKTLKHFIEVALHSCTDVEELARADAHEPDGAPPPRRAPTPADRRAAPRPRERRAAEPAGLARRARADAAAAGGQQAALRRRPQSHGAPARAARARRETDTPPTHRSSAGRTRAATTTCRRARSSSCNSRASSASRSSSAGASRTCAWARARPSCASRRRRIARRANRPFFAVGCRATCRTRRSAPRGRSASSLKDPTRPRRWTACSGSTRPRT